MVGGYGEYEALNTEGEGGSRFGFGLTYVARYPGDLSSGLGFELGGKLGMTFAGMGDPDSQFGTDFGVFLGPIIQIAPNVGSHSITRAAPALAPVCARVWFRSSRR